MSRIRVYLKTYDSAGNLLSDFTEITEYVDASSMGTIVQELDSSDYNIGVIRNSNLSIKLNNQEGLFSTPDIADSLFRSKRDDSIIKITYDFTSYDIMPGFFNPGEEIVSLEYDIFEGLLNDDATVDDAKTQTVSFQVLGYESILQKLQVPFASIANGDLISEIIYTCLNQTEFTSFISVDALNIDLDTDIAIDDVADLENKSVLDALKDLLLIANSVLYIDLDQVVHVVARVATADVQYTFYGQASNNGVENICELKDIRTGVNRVFNYWSWKDTANYQENVSSVTVYGARNKSIDLPLVTNSTSQNTILSNLLTEFADPKKEITVKAVINDEDILSLFLLDRVSIDYPQIILTGLGNTVPIYDVDRYDEVVYPGVLNSINIEPDDSWKVMKRKFDLKTETFEFSLRAI